MARIVGPESGRDRDKKTPLRRQEIMYPLQGLAGWIGNVFEDIRRQEHRKLPWDRPGAPMPECMIEACPAAKLS